MSWSTRATQNAQSLVPGFHSKWMLPHLAHTTLGDKIGFISHCSYGHWQQVATRSLLRRTLGFSPELVGVLQLIMIPVVCGGQKDTIPARLLLFSALWFVSFTTGCHLQPFSRQEPMFPCRSFIGKLSQLGFDCKLYNSGIPDYL